MTKRSSVARMDHQELGSEKSCELRCLWAGLFSVLINSCHGHSGPFKLISSRRPVKSNLADNSRTKFDNPFAHVDEVCQKNQKNEETKSPSTRVNASAKSVRNLILDDLYIDRHKHQSQSVDEKTVQQARTSVQAFIDQMFVDGKFVRKERTSNEPMPFYDALDVLSTTNNTNSFSEPNSHEKSSSRASKIKRKLQHTFGDLRKEPNRFSKAGDDCRFHVKTKDKPDNEPGVAFLTENTRKKIDFSSSRFSKKRHYISVRLKSLNEIETKTIFDSEEPIERNRTDTILLNIRNSTTTHSTMDSVSENEMFTSTVEDVPSTPTSAHDLNLSENNNFHEEHQSPVSVLERFLAEDANNAPNIMPKRIYFEESSVDSNPQYQPVSEIDCNDKQYYIARYVHSVLRASRLSWDRLSRISPRCEELLRPSLFDEVEFSCSDYRFDSKLLFDHINEVLVQLHRARFTFVKPKNNYVQLEELVVDEIMTKAAELYLNPRAEERTVDELVKDDVSGSGPWIEAQPEAERIVLCITEDIMEEYVWDIIFGFHS